MGRVVSFINLKGGVGKSTIAMIIAEFLVFRYYKRVLLIDMDAQGNLTYCMVPEDNIQQQRKSGRTVYHLLREALNGGHKSLGAFVTDPPLVVSNIQRASLPHPHDRHVLHMVISIPDVAQLDDELIQMWEDGKPIPRGIRQSLRDSVESVRRDYDFVILDCPPGLSVFSSTALVASDLFISPVIPEPLSLQGVELVTKRAAELNRRGADVQFGGIVLNIVKHYRNTHRKWSELIYGEDSAALQPYRWWIPDNERLRKLGEFDPDVRDATARRDQFDPKFGSVREKYDSQGTLANPSEGALARGDTEGKRYRIVERLERLTEEFLERCG